jgi:hypothetical protein
LSNGAQFLLKTAQTRSAMATEKKVKSVKSSAPTFESVMALIEIDVAARDRARMIARLLENQPLDSWMTFELMEGAIQWLKDKKPMGLQ